MDNENISKWKFGINNNKLIGLVIEGKKTATCSLESDSYIGEKSIILYEDNNPAVMIKVNNIIKILFKDVTWNLARLEGENSNLDDWKKEHYNYFKNIDKTFRENKEIIFEIFEVIHIF